MRYAVLTNGSRWEAWVLVAGRPRSEGVIVETNLTTGEVPEIASSLWPLRRDELGVKARRQGAGPTETGQKGSRRER